MQVSATKTSADDSTSLIEHSCTSRVQRKLLLPKSVTCPLSFSPTRSRLSRIWLSVPSASLVGQSCRLPPNVRKNRNFVYLCLQYNTFMYKNDSVSRGEISFLYERKLFTKARSKYGTYNLSNFWQTWAATSIFRLLTKLTTSQNSPSLRQSRPFMH